MGPDTDEKAFLKDIMIDGYRLNFIKEGAEEIELDNYTGTSPIVRRIAAPFEFVFTGVRIHETRNRSRFS